MISQPQIAAPRGQSLPRSMLDQRNHLVGPTRGVVNGEVVAVNRQKFSHRNKSCSFVTLLERMCLGHAGEQSHRERDNVLLTLGERVLRPCQSAIQQSWITQEIPLPGYGDDGAIDFDDYLKQQPSRLIW
jgi:hypothetical protein